MKALTNGRLVTPNGVLEDKAVLFTEQIEEILPQRELASYEGVELIDVEGSYVGPGFIDLHLHGAGGKDTMDATQKALDVISQTVVETGVTGFLPTTMTMSGADIHQALTVVRESMEASFGARVLGAHMEGPFLNPQYKGAQSDDYIQQPNFELIADYLDVIKVITLAPEQDDNFEFIKQMKSYDGITISIGHSNADYDQALEAINQGVANVTHLFNAMNSFHHRHPGILGAAFNTDVVCELIADTIHVHPDLFQLVVKIKGKDNLVLVTDSMRAGGMDPGDYKLGGQQVTVNQDSARLKDGTLAGSILTLNQAVKNMVANTNLTVSEVVKMASLNPAQVLGIAETKGSIAVGKDADFAVFNDEFAVKQTIIAGEKVYG